VTCHRFGIGGLTPLSTIELNGTKAATGRSRPKR